MIIGLINLNHPEARNARGHVVQGYLHAALANLINSVNAIGVSAAPKNIFMGEDGHSLSAAPKGDFLGEGFHYLTYRKWSPSMTVEKADKWRKKQWEKWAPPKRLPVRLRLVKTDE